MICLQSYYIPAERPNFEGENRLYHRKDLFVKNIITNRNQCT